MSTLPTRTRSLRKPSVGVTRLERAKTISTTADRATTDTTATAIPTAPTRTRTVTDLGRTPGATSPRTAPPTVNAGRSGASSPSRLPVKPSSTGTPRSNVIPTRPTKTSTASTPHMLGSRPPVTRSNLTKSSAGTTGSERSIVRPRAGSKTSAVTIAAGGRPRAASTTTTTTTTRHARTSSATALPSTLSVANSGTSRYTHTRHKSQGTVLTPATTLPPPSSSSNSTTVETRRPQFSTYQQHYSPVKSQAPKPTTAAILAPPSPSKQPANVALSAATARLQAELLQLQLLHIAEAPTRKQWHASARQKLGEKLESVRRQFQQIVEEEGRERAQRNAMALRVWEKGPPGWGLEEKVQTLDEVLGGVWTLSENGGRYAKVVKRFERWITGVQGVMDGREKSGIRTPFADDQGNVIFITGLDDAWRSESHLLTRKLQGWAEQLRDIGPLRPQGKDPETIEDVEEREIAMSSLATVLDHCGEMVKGMLEELDTIRRIEQRVVQREHDWIRDMNDASSDEESLPTAGAVWRSV